MTDRGIADRDVPVLLAALSMTGARGSRTSPLASCGVQMLVAARFRMRHYRISSLRKVLWRSCVAHIS